MNHTAYFSNYFSFTMFVGSPATFQKKTETLSSVFNRTLNFKDTVLKSMQKIGGMYLKYLTQ